MLKCKNIVWMECNQIVSTEVEKDLGGIQILGSK